MFINNEHMDILNTMTQTPEHPTIEQALAVIREKAYPFEITTTGKSAKPIPAGAEAPAVRMTIRYGTVEHRLECIEKNRVDKTTAALHVAGSPGGDRAVIVTPYVSPDMAECLKGCGVEFMDTCGNLYLHRPPLYLFVKGNRPGGARPAVPVIRAFKPGGLKVIFALLSVKGAEKKTYRELSAMSGVSLGTVDWVMKDLMALGFMIDKGANGRTLIKKKELIDRWVIAYPEQLKLKLKKTPFHAADNEWWMNADVEKNRALWSGEVAAAKLTHYLNPRIMTLYVKQPVSRLVVDHKLRHDENGAIEVFEVFWNFVPEKPAGPFVPPILIYADLMATGDARNIETATRVYHEYIAELIG